MAISKNYFQSVYLLKKKEDTFHYRNHINFFNKLLSIIITNDKYIFINKNVFIDYIIYEIKSYLKEITTQESNTTLILFFLHKIKEYRRYSAQKIYHFLLTTIGTIYYLSCYSLSILCSSTKNLSASELSIITKKILEAYSISSKLILVLPNQNLVKGISFIYKNNLIDLSLKKLENIIKKNLKNGEE
jgi:hypothetical protein